MQSTSARVTLENVKKLIRRNAKGPLYKVLGKLHPADVAYIIGSLSDLDRKHIWGFLHDKSRIAEIILELDEPYIIELFTGMPPESAADVLMEMESDDVSYILRTLPDTLKETILSEINGKALSEVEELLHYPERSTGAMMNTEYIALSQAMTVKEATKFIHNKAVDIEMVYYLYLVDDEGRLVGVLSLRQLILNPPEKTLAEIMIKDVLSVLDSTDRQEAAALVDKYDLLALPVVDEQRRMVGIITFDDIIDVIREEAAEDMYRMTGTPQELTAEEKPLRSARIRLPWLFITLLGELVSGVTIVFFQGRLADFLVLSAFTPVIMAMGGNVGSQSATIVIRGVALGKVDTRRMLPILWRELRVGLIMGAVSAIPVTFLAPYVHAGPHIGIIVGAALFFAMTFAAFTGTFVPMMLLRFKVDPAVASGPFISLLNDITGLTIYFSTALVLVTLLG
ncbi:MAG: magnesium transporter [Deferribacteraceae bacterium]|jgi:magnesium transporter|nr:magnesium transporter [Deferribacteraceae bacterium]